MNGNTSNPNTLSRNRSNWKRTASSVTVSSVMHLAFFGLAALIYVEAKTQQQRASLESVWYPPELTETTIEIRSAEPPEPRVSEFTANPGGSSLAELLDLTMIASATDFASLDELSPDLDLPESKPAPPVRSAAKSKSAAPSIAGGVKPSAGRGRGDGDGAGDGKGFFGSIPGKKRIVFVVDNSRSMNHKHDSTAKTRFRRLKIELIKSILELPADHEFFVIFFADVMLPMPADSLQPASPQSKDHYLRWLAQVDTGGGPTDPRSAMSTALRFQPDLIYFLTDGEFQRGVNLKLQSIKQARTAIHTFAFGEKLGEEVLQDIAQKNGGEYKFVP